MDVSSIALLKTNMQIRDGADLMVMKKAMDTAKENSQAMLETMKAALPHLGNNVDIRV